MVGLSKTLSLLSLLGICYTCLPVYASRPSSWAAQGSLSPSVSKFSLKEAALQASLRLQAGSQFNARLSYSSRKSTFADNAERKSRGRAFAQSLLLPGWGQHYAQSKTMMKVFIVSEALLWGSFFGFTAWNHWLENDYRAYAVAHAGVSLTGKSGRYFVDIAGYDNIHDYNQAQLRARDLARLYPVDDDVLWQWESTESRREYQRLKVRSDRASNRAELTIAAIVINHLVSAIQSTLAAFKYNKRQENANIGFDMRIESLQKGSGLVLMLRKNFN